MELKVDLKAKPFYLDDEQIRWVKETIEGMTLDEKIGQLFLFMSPGTESASDCINAMEKIRLRPCGLLLRGDSSKNIWAKIGELQNFYPIPLFIAGDLERGASNMIVDGTPCGHELEISATNEPELGYQEGLCCARECAAVGANWNFGPVIDIDYNPYNPVTNVRTFGSNPDHVLTFARRVAQGMRDGGLVPCIKHWPGDGVDGRDQHFLSTVNSLSVEEWDQTYGKVYQGMIDDGIETVMTAHIMQPAYTRYFSPEVKDEEILPASLSTELNQKLLREKMGFNGLIITDATSMVGFTEVLPRSQAVPRSIASGADIFLFTRDMEEDFEYMKKGVEDGVLTMERIEEALTRTLGLKAKMNLHTKKADGTLVPPESALEIFEKKEGLKLAKEIADKSITLVKDTQNLLPLSVEKQKNIFMVPIGDTPNYHNARGGFAAYFKKKMEEKGFCVTCYDGSDELKQEIGKAKISEFKEKYDVLLYFCNVSTNGSDSAVRITWPGLRVTMPSLMRELPTMMVSIDNPYHLIDAPRIKTYINAYTSEEVVVDALVEKLAGESEFKGVSPINAFAGIFNADK